MTRRSWLIAWPAVAFAQDDERRAAIQVIRDASRALNAGNAGLFLKKFDRATKGFAAIERHVVALTQVHGIASSIQVNRIEPEGDGFRVEVNWLLQLTPASGLGTLERREEAIALSLGRKKKRWRIVSFQPVDFLSAIQ